ncbi:cysteine hydrolase family protein [Paraburkholderia sp. Ac-20340]|uniref:cysteine hydrolase family protein n=1 Tax=Paraburkholderia sp. Ac-20340 TaxID=2703888 RepID=UPI0032167304
MRRASLYWAIHVDINALANMPCPLPPPGAVLLLIDLQQAIDHPGWGVRNNPQAEEQVRHLLKHWREKSWPVWHVRHDSTEPQSHYRPGQAGHAFKPQAMPAPGEPIIAKQTNSAFIGTDLQQRLRAQGHDALVVAGVITNNSVEATVRMAGNLGFRTWLVADACFTFARRDWNGTLRSADEVHAMSLANLHGEYCNVVTADELLTASGR